MDTEARAQIITLIAYTQFMRLNTFFNTDIWRYYTPFYKLDLFFNLSKRCICGDEIKI